MTQVPPSPLIPFDDEKNPRGYGADAETNISPIASGEESEGSTDGDDALKLVGTHAHHFDAAYNRRLLRKIVSHLEVKHLRVKNVTDFPLGPSRHASSHLCLLHPVLG
jgi:hypothetical protein